MKANAPSRPATRFFLLVLASLALALDAQRAQSESPANDFPTIERVLFVEGCTRDHPDRPRTEMLYKCSCAIDVLARDLSFEDYVSTSTAFYAAQVAGERGTRIRESTTGRELAERFRSAREQAARQCMLGP